MQHDLTRIMDDEVLGADSLGGFASCTEIANGHTPRGCPFQAWSVAEPLRLDRIVVADTNRPRNPSAPPKRLTESHENNFS